MLVLLAYAQAKTGMRTESSDTLQQARRLALRFDSAPDYSLKAMRFAEHTEPSAFFDVFGATASESTANLIRLLKDQRFADQWTEATGDET